MLWRNRMFSPSHYAIITMRFRSNHWIILLGLGVSILLPYFHVLSAHFISDDFKHLSYLIFNSSALLDGQKWDLWLIGGIDGYLYFHFRPAGYVLMFLDFLMWNTAAWGYHLTNLILHWLVSFEVYLVGYLLSRQRGVALCSALLFALMSVHSEAVSWIAARHDVMAGFFCLASLIFFILAQRRLSVWFYMISLIAFVLAISSKETAIPFPVILFFYDALFNMKQLCSPRYVIRYHLAYWIVPAIRLTFFGHGYQGLSISPEKITYWLDGNLSNLVLPLVDVISPDSRWLLILGILLVCLVFRARRVVLFGMGWVPLMAVATLTSGPSERSFYLPSVGLAIAMGNIFADGVYARNRALRSAGIIALLTVVCAYGVDLYGRNQDMYRAGQITEAIPARVQQLYPVLPKGVRLVFVGVPEYTSRGTLVYITGFPNALQIAYRDPTLFVLKANKFPLWLDALDRTLYFQVDHRKVSERTDLIQILQERVRCESYSVPFQKWSFAEIASDWEQWNQLSDLGSRDGAVMMRAVGNDPIMASPPINIPSLAIGEIQVTMNVRAAQPILQGEWYWLASGQEDFSPGLKVGFPVLADGEWHTYRVNLAQSGMLLMGDDILRIRFDPVNAPAEIAIHSITIYTHCDSSQRERCLCYR